MCLYLVLVCYVILLLVFDKFVWLVGVVGCVGVWFGLCRCLVVGFVLRCVVLLVWVYCVCGSRFS